MEYDIGPLQTSFCVLASAMEDADDCPSPLGLLHAQQPSEAAERTPTDPLRHIVPVWKPDVRELWFAGQFVKKFKQPAPSQEMILAAFQEEGWPPHILDPLPPRSDSVPSQRLRATIRNLNARQRNALIRFESDGHGEGICWYPRLVE